MFGVLSWFITIIISVLVFFAINKFLSHYLLSVSAFRKTLIVVIFPAIVTDLLIHIFIILESGYSEMIMWASISFPYVLVCLIFVNLLIKLIFDWRQGRQQGSKK
jgi:hypothetical protein